MSSDKGSETSTTKDDQLSKKEETEEERLCKQTTDHKSDTTAPITTRDKTNISIWTKVVNNVKNIKFDNWTMIFLVVATILNIIGMISSSYGCGGTGLGSVTNVHATQEFMAASTSTSFLTRSDIPKLTMDIFRTVNRKNSLQYHNASMLQFVSLLGHEVHYNDCGDRCIDTVNKTVLTDKYNEFSDDFIPVVLNVTKLVQDMTKTTSDQQIFFGDDDLPISFVCSHYIGQIINFVIVRVHRKYGIGYVSSLPLVSRLDEQLSSTHYFYILFDPVIEPPSHARYAYLDNNNGLVQLDLKTNVFHHQPLLIKTENFMREYVDREMIQSIQMKQKVVIISHKLLFEPRDNYGGVVQKWFQMDADAVGAIAFCNQWTRCGGKSISKYELPSMRMQEKRLRNEAHNEHVRATAEQIQQELEQEEQKQKFDTNNGQLNVKIDITKMSKEELEELWRFMKKSNNND